MTSPDVLVVGAGPSGSTAGGLLAQGGWDVEIVDRARFPRYKACGECLNPGAVATLRRLGLLERVRALDPAPLTGWRVRTVRSGSALGTFQGTLALGVPRYRLDAALLDAARSRGARVLCGAKVRSLDVRGREGGPRVRVREPDGAIRVRRPRVVVGADGLRSVVARSLGAHARRPRLRKVSLTGRVRGWGPDRDRGHLVLGDQETVGLAPVATREDLWNATVVLRSEGADRRIRGDTAAFLRFTLSDSGFAWSEEPELLAGPWASGPFDWPVRSAVGPGVVLVGDAAGYYDPLTGQGIYRALRSAEMAAATIDRSLRRDRISRRDLGAYDRALRREFRASRWIQKTIEGIVSRAALREPVVSFLADVPDAISALIHVTGDAAPPRSLLAPGIWLGR